MSQAVEILHGHLFCGLGGGAKGFNRAQPRAGGAGRTLSGGAAGAG